MICGPNGAGKSTWSKGIVSRNNLVCIDTDALAAGGLSSIAAGKAAAEIVRTMLNNGVSFARESTLTAKFDFQIMQQAREIGYAIHLTYIRLESLELAISRVMSRVRHGGHVVDIRRRFQRSLENLPKALEIVDDYVIIDNSKNNYSITDKGAFHIQTANAASVEQRSKQRLDFLKSEQAVMRTERGQKADGHIKNLRDNDRC